MKAISPVIATVIIVAVAIAISIAVALWITGLTSSFTGVEKLEIINAYAESGTDASGNTYWLINVVIKNTGTKPATIDNIFINNKPGTITNAYADGIAIPSTGKTLDPGKTTTITFLLTSTGNPIEDVKKSTRTVQNAEKPYISEYPSLVIYEPGSTATLSITIKQGTDTSIDHVDVLIYDQDGKKAGSVENFDISGGENTADIDVTLPSTIGSYTWTINVTKVGDPNTVYDSVEFTVIAINPIITDRFSSGQTVSIVVHTASGGQYPATVTLP